MVHCKKHKKQNYNHNPNVVQCGNSKYKRKNKEKKEKNKEKNTHPTHPRHLCTINLYTLQFNIFWYSDYNFIVLAACQPTITCSKLTIETLEQGVKSVQS